MFFLASLEEHISGYSVGQVSKHLHALIVLEVVEQLLMGLHAEVFLLKTYELVYVVLELVGLQLLQVVLRKDHMLDELGDLLIELHHVGRLVHELLDGLPVLEGAIVVLLRAASEAQDKFAEHLACSESVGGGLLDSKNIIITIKLNIRKGLDHRLFYNFS